MRFFEPVLPREGLTPLEDAAFELTGAARSLAGQIHPIVQESVGDLVRSMNCYYSNLIEGHNTLPRDIEKALGHDYAAEPKKRNLQLEAVAHIEVQRMIDAGEDGNIEPASVQYIRWLHGEFCRRLPEDLLWVENPDTGERLRVVPGEIRTRGVSIGRHIPPNGEELDRCLRRFEEAYRADIGKFRKVIAVAAAHHRFLWIHPFLDGNGRVARLLSHAMFHRLGIGSSLWSVSRGLARQVREYKMLLMEADEPRAHDTDGRGTLSERALVRFCEYFLRVSLDQVIFMQTILDPANLVKRIERFCHDEPGLPDRSFLLLRVALLAGEVARERIPSIVGMKERAARMITKSLTDRGLLVAKTHKAPLRIAFPVAAVERWFPALYPVA